MVQKFVYSEVMPVITRYILKVGPALAKNSLGSLFVFQPGYSFGSRRRRRSKGAVSNDRRRERNRSDRGRWGNLHSRGRRHDAGPFLQLAARGDLNFLKLFRGGRYIYIGCKRRAAGRRVIHLGLWLECDLRTPRRDLPRRNMSGRRGRGHSMRSGKTTGVYIDRMGVIEGRWHYKVFGYVTTRRPTAMLAR